MALPRPRTPTCGSLSAWRGGDDLLDGAADGCPPLSRELHAGLEARSWMKVLDDTFERFLSELELIESELPEGLDPDSAEADRFYAHLPFDPYAAHDEAEFFAVTSEALVPMFSLVTM